MTTITRPQSMFLSYAHTGADRTWIERFRQSLEEQGASVWSDDAGVIAGDSIADTIEAALREADTLVAIVGQSDDANLYFEIGAARAMGKQIVTIVPDGVDRSKLPGPLRVRRFLVKGEPQETARALVA